MPNSKKNNQNVIFLKTSIFILNSLFILPNSRAESVEDFYKFFKTSKYLDAKASLEKIDFKDKESTKFYLLGLTHARLQEFDQAIVNFEKAKRLNNEAIDLNYELGQAYYAATELKKAILAFEKSSELNFNRTNSLYYIGTISQTLEDYNKARESFTKIIKDKTSPDSIVQLARFQLAETLLSVAREKKESSSIVEKYVLPLMQQAIDTDTTSTVARDIKQRILEITNEFNLDPNVMVY